MRKHKAVTNSAVAIVCWNSAYFIHFLFHTLAPFLLAHNAGVSLSSCMVMWVSIVCLSHLYQFVFSCCSVLNIPLHPSLVLSTILLQVL